MQWLGFRRAPEGETWSLSEEQITHFALPGHSTRAAERASEDLTGPVHAAKEFMAEFEPDIVLTYGGTQFELELRQHARNLGARIAFYLVNPSYKNRSAFDNVDLIFTDTQATAALYKERLDLDCVEIGKFIDRPTAKRPAKANRHVTFVNPSFPKGATLFFRIAEMMLQTLPSVRFMVVESRASLCEIEKQSGIPFSGMRNIRRLGLQADMNDVFSLSHTILIPSLWHESGSRLAVEALSLGIPIVCSDHGGLPQIVGDGGVRIAVPEPMRQNNRLIPPPSVAVPWVSVLARLWTDDHYWSEQHAAAIEQWSCHDPQQRVKQVEISLQDLIDG